MKQEIVFIAVGPSIYNYGVQALHGELAGNGFTVKTLFILKKIGDSLSETELSNIEDLAKMQN